MSGSRPESVIDPVCGMTVNVGRAEADGLTLEHDGRTYAFCRGGCLRAFREEPVAYAAKAEIGAPVGVAAEASGLPVIDEGMRRWYESCSCCLSDAYPEVKAALDAERAAQAAAPVGAGICEIAEAPQEAAAT
jgi:YHS domain-containing protein